MTEQPKRESFGVEGVRFGSAAELHEWNARAQVAFKSGGPNLKDVAVGEAKRLDLSQEETAKIAEGWDLVAIEVSRAAAGSIRARVNKILAEQDQSEARASAARVAELMGMVAEARARARPDEELEPEPEEEKEEGEEGEAGTFGEDLEELNPDEEAVLSPGAPYDNAREYARRYCFRDGFLATYCWHKDLWQWNGRTYQKMNEDDLRASVYKFLDHSFKIEVGKDGTFQRNRFRPKPSDVNALIDGLKAGLAMSADWYPPMWLHTKTKASDVWVFANGVLDIRTGELMEPSPRLWVHGAVEFDWDPEAECPVWDRFLEDIFPGDVESKEFIEEWLGYSKTEDTRFQKGALFIGDPRSGKSTILAVMEMLVSPGRSVSLSFNNWMKDDKSLEPLIGKTVGAFPDVRLRPPKLYGASYDAGGLDHASAELLLKLTAGDKVTIARKYINAWEGNLPIKMTLISNVIPNFNDAVLPTRFVKLAFEVSFLGREDITLPKRLEAELPGIARRALEGYWRAVERGRFVQPKSGLKLKEQIEEEIDPFAKFVRETFEIDAEGTVMIGLFEVHWKQLVRTEQSP